MAKPKTYIFHVKCPSLEKWDFKAVQAELNEFKDFAEKQRYFVPNDIVHYVPAETTRLELQIEPPDFSAMANGSGGGGFSMNTGNPNAMTMPR